MRKKFSVKQSIGMSVHAHLLCELYLSKVPDLSLQLYWITGVIRSEKSYKFPPCTIYFHIIQRNITAMRETVRFLIGRDAILLLVPLSGKLDDYESAMCCNKITPIDLQSGIC